VTVRWSRTKVSSICPTACPKERNSKATSIQAASERPRWTLGTARQCPDCLPAWAISLARRPVRQAWYRDERPTSLHD